MNELIALREAIARLLGGRYSLKRARQADYLFVLFGPEDVAPLKAAGYSLTPLGERRWGLEPPRSFYEKPLPAREPAWQPGPAYQLYRMAQSHRADTSLQAVRCLVKALEAGEADACCRQLLALCAQRLRLHQPLPGYLTPWLMEHLQ